MRPCDQTRDGISVWVGCLETDGTISWKLQKHSKKMCGVIIESESHQEGRVGDRGFKIVFRSDCGDADHSDGLNGTARSGTKEWTLHLRLTAERGTLFGERTEKGECEANFNYLADVFWERRQRLSVGRGLEHLALDNGTWLMLESYWKLQRLINFNKTRTDR